MVWKASKSDCLLFQLRAVLLVGVSLFSALIQCLFAHSCRYCESLSVHPKWLHLRKMGSLNPNADVKQELEDSGYVQDESGKQPEEYQGSAEMLDLSDDVLLLILRNCTAQDLKAVAFTCERLGTLVLDRSLWVDVDSGSASLGRRRVRWLLNRALGPHTRRLRLRGYAQDVLGCMGFTDRFGGQAQEFTWLDEDRYFCGGLPVPPHRVPLNLRRFHSGPRPAPTAPPAAVPSAPPAAVPTAPPAAQNAAPTAPPPAPAAFPTAPPAGSTAPPTAPTAPSAPPPSPSGLPPAPSCVGPQLTLTKAGLSQLTTLCTGLSILELDDCVIDCQSTTIGMFPKTLTKLSLRGSICYNLESKSFLFKIQDHLTLLEDLDVSYCSWIEPACLLPLSKLPSLCKLFMRECLKLAEFVAYASLATRYGFKKLKLFDLRGCPVGDSEVSSLGWLPCLEELYLSPAKPRSPANEHAHSSQEKLPEHKELEEWEENEPEFFTHPASTMDVDDGECMRGTRTEHYSNEDSSACILLERMIAEPVDPNEYDRVYRQFRARHSRNVPLASPSQYREAYRMYMSRREAPPADPAAGPSKRRREGDEPTAGTSDQSKSSSDANEGGMPRCANCNSSDEDDGPPNKRAFPGEESAMTFRDANGRKVVMKTRHVIEISINTRQPNRPNSNPANVINNRIDAANDGNGANVAVNKDNDAVNKENDAVNDGNVVVNNVNDAVVAVNDAVNAGNSAVNNDIVQNMDVDDADRVTNNTASYKISDANNEASVENNVARTAMNVAIVNNAANIEHKSINADNNAREAVDAANNTANVGNDAANAVNAPSNVANENYRNDGTGCVNNAANVANNAANMPNYADNFANNADDFANGADNFADLEAIANSADSIVHIAANVARNVANVAQIAANIANNAANVANSGANVENNVANAENNENKAADAPNNAANVGNNVANAAANDAADAPSNAANGNNGAGDANNAANVANDADQFANNADNIVHIAANVALNVANVAQFAANIANNMANAANNENDAAARNFLRNFIDPNFIIINGNEFNMPEPNQNPNLAPNAPYPRYRRRNYMMPPGIVFPPANERMPHGMLLAPPVRPLPLLDRASLVTDSAIHRFGRADGDNVNFIHIGGNGRDDNARPDRSNLRILSVPGYRRIGNASLVHLATAAPFLRRLDVSNTSVNESGIERFKALRPDVDVIVAVTEE